MRHLNIPNILLIASLIFAITTVSCKKADKEQSYATSVPSFPTPPMRIVDPTERASFVVNNIWKGVVGVDTLTFRSSGEREQFLVNYFGFAMLASEQSRRNSISKFFELSTPAMDSIILRMASRYFDTPGSPMFDQASFIQIQEEADKQGLLDFAQQVRLEDRRTLFLRNQVGQSAEDFEYMLANGRTNTLYNTQSGKKLLLMFYDPECPVCKHVLEFLSESEPIRSSLGKDVSLLCIYVDSDVELWKERLPQLPSHAIAGRDATGRITDQSLYDLRVLPTLYLLDGERRVILKDAFPDQLEAYFMAQEETMQ